jgi:hypothetical protein
VCPAPTKLMVVHPSHAKGCGVVAPFVSHRLVGLEDPPRTRSPKHHFSPSLLVLGMTTCTTGGAWHPGAHPRTDGGHVGTTGKTAGQTPSQHPGHPAMRTRLAPTFGSKVRKLFEAWCLSPCSDAEVPHPAPVHPQHHTGGVWCVGGIAGWKGVCGGGHSHVFGPGLGEGWVATSLLLTPMCGTCTHPSQNARASSPVCV